MKAELDKIRKVSRETNLPIDTVIQMSIAISLKRIADNLAAGSHANTLRAQISKSLGEIAEAKKKGL